MRIIASLVCVWLGLWTAQARVVSDKIESVILYGKSYLKLLDWADANDYEVKWTKKGEELELYREESKLAFKVDAKRAEINGVAVWLSHSVAARKGDVFVTKLDFQKVIYPVLYPEKGKKTEHVKVVALDPGHGGKDPGNEDGSQQEKKYTLLLAQEIRAVLKTNGIKALLTREKDTYIELDDRAIIAKRKGADMFVSLHFNAAREGRNGPPTGVEIYSITPAGASSTNGNGESDGRGYPGNRFDDRNVLLAYLLQRSVVHAVGAEDRGIRRARWAVLRNQSMPAVLIEGGFMTEAAEAKRIYNAAHRHKLAEAIVAGILDYKKTVEP